MSEQWTFLTNYGHVIIFLDKHPDATVREISDQIGITERAVLKIISDLAHDGYLEIKKNGRNNSYIINANKTLRHKLEKSCKIKRFIQIIEN
ncbi:MAG: MarR family transcriptional regulator [Bacteriovoracaceae bacterium]|nr:MarR family transcriptional regulator [Bacteriovoracaceae bacterium]